MEANNNNAASAGAVDPSFANAGLQTLSFPGYTKAICKGMALTPSGFIMVSVTVSKEAETYYGLARLHPDGNVDVSFGQDGYVSGQYTNGTLSQGGPLIIDADGGMVVCGLIGGGPYQQVIAKFNPSGSLNRSFGGDPRGYVIVPMRVPDLFNASGGHISFVRSRSDSDVKDRILFLTSRNGTGLIARYDFSGIEDRDFSEGWVLVKVDNRAITLKGFTEREDGKILVYGSADVPEQGFVRAYDNTGEINEGFGTGGTLLLDVQHQGKTLGSTVNTIIEQPSQRLLTLGYAIDRSGSEALQHALMIGLTTEGHMDPAFNGGAPVITQANARDLRNWSAGAALNGSAGQRIVTLGQTTGEVRRLLTGGFLADGQADPAFDTEGAARVAFLPDACCVQGSSMLVAGTKDETTQVIRMFTAAVT